MKWNTISLNIWGLNDPESILKEHDFLNSLTPRADIIMIQEHKLRGRALKNLGLDLCLVVLVEGYQGNEVGSIQMHPIRGGGWNPPGPPIC